jgi:hypothetical protein
MVFACEYCPRAFTRFDNLKRHQRMAHRKELEEVQELEEVKEPEEESDDSVSERSEEHSEVDESEEEIKDESEQEDNKRWRKIIGMANESFTASFEDPEELLAEPLLSQFIETMRLVLNRELDFVHDMEHEDELYDRLKRRADKYDDFVETDEAEETAWNDLRIPLKKVIQKNLDLFDETDDSSTDDSSSDC